jgi:hypothetical protein
MRIVRFLVALLAFGTWLPLSAGRALACTCIEESDRAAARRAVTIFTGVAGATSQDDVSVTPFTVQRVYKGATDGATMEVTHTVGGASCGVTFREGVRYTVFLDEDERGSLLASLCSPHPRGEIDPERYGLPAAEVIDIGQPPLPEDGAGAGSGRLPWIIAIVVALAGPAFLAWRGRRAARAIENGRTPVDP